MPIGEAVLDIDELMDAVERQNEGLDNPGFCTSCGAEVDGCEPDAEEYDCEVCGAEGTVYGAEQLLILGV